MDTSGCQAVFAETELARFLSTKSLELYHRLRLAQELEDAAIEGLETCPSCPWAVVIDNPEEKLIHCLNEACLKVSCRFCRKPVRPRLETGKSDANSRNISLLAAKVSHSTRIY
jgi:TRIAD3 protein (E3 ubiquitin-protein ligase RNF216)